MQKILTVDKDEMIDIRLEVQQLVNASCNLEHNVTDLISRAVELRTEADSVALELLFELFGDRSCARYNYLPKKWRQKVDAVLETRHGSA